jgi:hypothetical protein
MIKELYADLVLLNGKVITVDGENSVARAVAAKDGLILKVGRVSVVKKTIGPETEVIDAEGLTVLPGLIDSHMHPGNYGVFWVRGVRCGPDVDSIDELLERIRAKTDATPEGRWMLGYALDDLKLGRYPTRRELDDVTPRNPLYIQNDATFQREGGNPPHFKSR